MFSSNASQLAGVAFGECVILVEYSACVVLVSATCGSGWVTRDQENLNLGTESDSDSGAAGVT